MKGVLKAIAVGLICIAGTIGIIYFIDQKSFLAVLVFIATIILCVIFSKIFDIKRCPRCSGKGRPTSVSGSKYKQWLCEKCDQTFWTTLYSEKYH